MTGPHKSTNGADRPQRLVTHDILLDHAQGRLSPTELAALSQRMAEDPALQQQYAELRRLRRLVNEAYRPPVVATPDVRDEDVSAMIDGFVDAIRSGVLPPTPELPPVRVELEAEDEVVASLLAATPPTDYTANNGTAPDAPADFAPVTLAAVPATDSGRLTAEPKRGSAWRAMVTWAGYAAAAALLLAAAFWSFIDDGPITNDAPAPTANQAPELPPVDTPDPIDFNAMPDPEQVDAPDTPVTPDGPGTPDGPVGPDEPGHVDTPDRPVDPVAPDAITPGIPEHVDTPGRPDGSDVPDSPFAEERLIEQVRAAAGAGSFRALHGTPGAGASDVVVGQTLLRGDLDGNGRVDHRDLSRLLQHLLAGNANGLGVQGDLNRDQVIDSRDYVSLMELTRIGD